jgi:hypothetical protein
MENWDEDTLNVWVNHTYGGYFVNKNGNICSCGKPVFPNIPLGFPGKCVYCLEYPESDKKCYLCDLCKQDRIYLKQTDTIFGLEGYGQYEVWRCKECKACLTFEIKFPSIIRDIEHVKIRKIHLGHHCAKIQNRTFSW